MRPSELSERALAKLRASAIDAKLAAKLGIGPVPTPFGPAADDIRIPYFEPDGKRNCFYRDRLFDNPRQKYNQPDKTAPRLYLPPLLDRSWAAIAADTSVDLIVTEGELKTACACAQGFPTVGLGGVDSFSSNNKPIADLDLFAWRGRVVSVAYDSDWRSNPNVHRALVRFASELCGRGAVVRIVDLPAGPKGEKVGLDDFLEANGPAALRALLDKAETFPDVVGRLNQTHFVTLVGNKLLIGTETVDSISDAPDLALLSEHDLRSLYANDLVGVGDKSVNAGTYWMASRWRRELLGGIVFAPEQETPNAYNLWRGFAVVPKAGKCDLYLDHVQANVCGGDVKLYRWVLAWMADVVQRPATLPGTAIALRGGQGTGKGVCIGELGQLLGPHFVHVSSPRHVHGNFNAHTKHALLLFADEAFWAGDKTAEGTLKAMITEPTRLIELKGKDAFRVRNYMRLMVASNHDWVVPAAFDERRFLVVDVADNGQAQNRDYFGRLVEQMERGGRGALLHYLQQYDGGGVDIASIPSTAALVDTKLRSLSGVELFVFELLRNADPQSWERNVATRVLQQRYYGDAKDIGEKRRANDIDLGRALSKWLGGVSTTRPLVNGRPVRTYVFRPLAECRKAFESKIGARIEWDAVDPTALRGGRRGGK